MTSEELRQRRLALELSQGRLGLLLGTSPANVHLWERGVHPVPAWVDGKLAEVEATRWKSPPGDRPPQASVAMTAEEFKQRRLALGLARARLGLLLGTSPANIYRWERGGHPIPTWVDAKLAEVERTRWPKKPA